ncbi:hypothetical protein CsatB_001609 [Cannabis sativa]|uniref:Uncharacterized protein n=1 Tax=Cannabis sativa TaxID=3483 RepID=A0A803QDU3_CANSA
MNRRVQDDWERLVRAILKREQLRAAGQRHERARTPSGIAGSVPASLLKTTNIDAILQVADEIQLEDPSVTRIMKGARSAGTDPLILGGKQFVFTLKY